MSSTRMRLAPALSAVSMLILVNGACTSTPTSMAPPATNTPVDASTSDASQTTHPPVAPALDAATDDSNVANPFDASTALDSAVDPADASTAMSNTMCPTGVSLSDPLPANLVATPVMSGFNFLEGPVWHAELGALFFSDMDFSMSGANGIASRIHRFIPPDQFDVFVPSSGSNGMALTVDGSILAATHDLQTLSIFDPRTGDRTSLALDYLGKHFNSPNDLTVRSDGNYYFSDPTWQLAPRTSEIGMSGVYRVDPLGNVSLVQGNLNQPNGVALSPDGNTLYVGSSDADVLAFPLDAAGAPGPSKVFASPGTSDGMAVDCAGNLYVVAGDVVVYSPTGNELGRIQVAGTPSNAAFGGTDRRTLYITAGDTLNSIQLNVPGYPY